MKPPAQTRPPIPPPVPPAVETGPQPGPSPIDKVTALRRRTSRNRRRRRLRRRNRIRPDPQAPWPLTNPRPPSWASRSSRSPRRSRSSSVRRSSLPRPRSRPRSRPSGRGAVAAIIGAVFGFFWLIFALLTLAWGLNSLLSSIWLGFAIVMVLLLLLTVGRGAVRGPQAQSRRPDAGHGDRRRQADPRHDSDRGGGLMPAPVALTRRDPSLDRGPPKRARHRRHGLAHRGRQAHRLAWPVADPPA